MKIDDKLTPVEIMQDMAQPQTSGEKTAQPQDDRLDAIESQKNAALSELEQTYDGMIGKSDKLYQDQIDASKEWAKEQEKLQQERTDFAIDQIEQQKQQAKDDYTKEQSGAYVDWQKQSAQHGVSAEQMASAGMAGSGYSESSKVAMYNTYQNRVATARAAVQKAITEYDNAITEARLQNNAALAEIAYNALQQQLTAALEAFQYKNSLVLDKLNATENVKSQYHSRYMDMLDQINQEAALEEEKRQFDAQMELAQKESGGVGINANGNSTASGSDDPTTVSLGDGNFKVTNEATDDWVEVGGKKMSWTELYEAVENGTVVEKEDEKTGAISFELAKQTTSTTKTTEKEVQPTDTLVKRVNDKLIGTVIEEVGRELKDIWANRADRYSAERHLTPTQTGNQTSGNKLMSAEELRRRKQVRYGK